MNVANVLNAKKRKASLEDEETKMLEEEGVNFVFLHAPHEILEKDDYTTLKLRQSLNYIKNYKDNNKYYGAKPIKEVLSHIKDFVPLIDNWAVCDNFCCSLKIVNKKFILL